MFLKLLAFMVVINLALSVSDPEPDPNSVSIDIKQVVNGECGGNRCCPEPEPGCVFGQTSFPNKWVNEETCFVIECNKGVWEYTGEIRADCENCTAAGDPHFWMFDEHCINGECGYKYDFYEDGDYVISQDDDTKNSPLSLFGLDAHLTNCSEPWVPWAINRTCVKNQTYYEPGITVTLSVNDFTPDIVDHCTNVSSDPTTDPQCAIKVFVNGKERIIGKSMHYFCATDGEVFVFQHNDIENNANINCVNIIGSKKLSVSLCLHAFDFSWTYVFAMPSLKMDPSKLYGLCDTYTGTTRDNYTMSGGAGTTDLNTFTESWKL